MQPKNKTPPAIADGACLLLFGLPESSEAGSFVLLALVCERRKHVIPATTVFFRALIHEMRNMIFPNRLMNDS